MHIPGISIHTLHQTRNSLLQRALQLLEEKINDYMDRPVCQVEIDTPRDVVKGFIVASAEEVLYDCDARLLLYLTVEDLSLVLTQPQTFEVDPQENDPPHAQYLIRTNVEEWIAKQLSHHVRQHPLCCEVCGREQANFFWFPHGPESSPKLIVGTESLGIGETCKAKLSSEETLIPFNRPDDPTIVPATYLTLAQRLARAQALFDGWLDHVNGMLGRMPDPQDVDNCIIHITFQMVPNLFREPLHLVLLAIEEPTLATKLPTHYGDLVDANSGEITAILLLHHALMAHVETRLHQRWQERTSSE